MINANQTETDTTANLSPVKRALLEIRELREKLDQAERQKTEPIAIVGLGLRFPGGANDPESFWTLLRDGVDTIAEVPPERWDINAYYDADPDKPGKMSTRFGAWLADVDKFDPYFFGIAPREAASMDPQHRLLLEVSWEALEHAGQSPEKLMGSQTGVFVGISNSDYFRMVYADPDRIDTYAATGNTYSVAAGRLSYLLGLHGPNVAIDTACSSSLVAVHLAVQSLRKGECNLALAGGVSVILTPEVHINFSRSRMMAADGRCKTFDAAADGYVRGEGCGMIALKRLSDAQADGDNILAVVRGAAINHDGRSGGLTAPNGPAQEAVIREALANSGVAPHEVSYAEAHGTGTSLGDPIEVRALGAVLGQGREAANPLMIGSVKTNVGHLEAAAGIAGLIKAVLALQHKEIPPHLHLKTLSPFIPWADLPITVPTQRAPWAGKRIAGVSSFGFSGTNAHIVLEEAPVVERKTADVERPLHLLTLSARSETALKTLSRRFINQLDSQSLADVCFTANSGRSHFAHRLAVVADSVPQAREKLVAFVEGRESLGMASGHMIQPTPPEVVFMFTGQGAQYVGMGRQLYETQPVFRKTLDKCDELLRPHLNQSLISLLNSQPSPLDETMYTQPALFAIQYALAELWKSWGIEPTVVLGHSAGEIVAACVAGVYNLEDGLKLSYERGRLMQTKSLAGEMVAVFADEARVAEAVAPFADKISIAAINGPSNVVISGAPEAVQSVVANLKEAGIKSRRLEISIASHSPMMAPMLDEFERVAATIKYSPPRIGLISNLSGQLQNEFDAGYWRRHIQQPVRFADSLKTLHEQGYKVFVEIGPKPTLLGMGQRCWPGGEGAGLWLPSLRDGRSDWEQILESLSALYVRGASVNWAGFDKPYSRRRLPLPTYPFERLRYWTDAAQSRPEPKRDVWESVVRAGQGQAGQGPLDLTLSTYSAKWDCLHRLTVAYVAAAFRELGVFGKAGEKQTAESLMAQCNIADTYRHLLRRWLEKLAAEGLLTQDGETFVSLKPLPDPELTSILNEARATLADAPTLLNYVEGCGSKLAAVLTGKESPLETLFPGGEYTVVEYIYRDWAVARYFNSIARSVVEAAQKAKGGKQLRVIEIGAGTGGTSSALLPALSPDSVYHYTDVSDFFLARAGQNFKDYAFVRYGLLDIEQDPAAQGYTPHSFDVVVAANALHATRNLHQTLQNARTLLAPGGLLVLYEATDHQSWFDITTGLIEGWQLFEDDLRTDNPLLSAEQWLATFQANGFDEAMALPERGSAAEILRQHILVARAPLTGQRAESAEPEWEGTRTNQVAQSVSASPTPAEELRSQLESALPDEREELLVGFARTQVTKVLRIDPSHPLDRKQRLMDLGVDSLMAVELRNLLTSGLGLARKLPATLMFDYPTVEAIARYLEREMFDGEKPAQTQPRLEAAQSALSADAIEQLSEDEVEALLLKKLDGMTK
ncbi:MAG: acyltransferase domain-containing protein [Chloroflexi bacterium]|nr:acyltransferase domain-containing protein [Chloroflexota bacterium]